MQQDILWGLSRPAFGIRPARPLRILCIQAENDDGDLYEMTRGVCDGLGLSDEDRAAIRDRVFYASERGRTGAECLSDVVAPLLKQHRPDILRIDPLLTSLSGDVNDAKVTAAFLRTGLNPLLEEFECAAIINHHTPKVTNRNTSEWRASDWMYAGAGSADLTNWCRAMIMIDPTHTPRVFKFIAAKRGRRIDWCDNAGQRVIVRLFCHEASDGIFWREANEADAAQVESSKPGCKTLQFRASPSPRTTKPIQANP